LDKRGARKQRLLWASTGTKNPEYSDVKYVESLIGPDTVATVPPETLRLFEQHGTIARALGGDQTRDAERVMVALADGGIDFGEREPRARGETGSRNSSSLSMASSG
jgi:transaldolase